MELRQLRYFAAVAEHGTYAAAASRLSIAQPALWRQVRDLERELGVPLFERVGRRVRLTRDGETLLAGAGAALAAVDRVQVAAADLRSARAGTIAISCASPHLRRFLAQVIGAFRRTHPHVAFELTEYGGGPTPGRSIAGDLLGGLVDLATGIPRNDPRFEGFPAYTVRLVAAVPDDHPWRDRSSVEVAELEGVPLVASRAGAYSRRTLEDACRRAGFEPRVAFDSASPSSVLALGKAGLGIPITIDDAVDQPAGRPWPGIVESGRPIVDTVGLYWRAGAVLSPTARAFVDVARSAADQAQVAISS
ncbi:MAG TPA: LysR family transcriptional regulator [Candidatus Limnocylindrales bacterium]|nr:LysR family transcriptional regulator [Candidatus Limnocylindrales bacterium]